MAATPITRGRLRRLVDLRPERGRVLSVFFDLDPTEFATPPARVTQLSSVLNDADRRIEAMEDLDHDERMALREDVQRVRAILANPRLASGGVRGLAVFACGPADLFEVIRLPHSIESRVEIDGAPFVEPLALAGERERWCVVLASRRNGRILLGSEDGLEEIDNVADDVHGQHDQGGWSQKRFQRGIEKEKYDHLDRLAATLLALSRRRPFHRLLIAAPEPLDDELESRLHPYLRELLAGRVQTDVEHATPSDVLTAAKPVFEEHRRAHELAAMQRLRAGIGRADGRAVAGLEAVTDALEQQRVEVLMLEPGNGLSDREELIERAIEQSAEVLVARHFPDLGPHGGVAALLRF